MIRLLLVTFLALAALVHAPGAKARGSGYRQNNLGNLEGTGDNFGRGWRRDTTGNFHGTGDNFDTTCRSDSSGNLNCQ